MHRSERTEVTEQRDDNMPRRASEARWVGRTPPLEDVIKVNFDGSVGGDGSASAACVFRNSEAVLVVVAGFLLCVSMQAAWEALRLAAAFLPGYEVWVEGDNLTVINWLQRRAIHQL